jgi:hypothetical protein
MRPDGEVDWIENASSEQFEGVLQKVSDDFHSFGNLGIYLSGGLDSVTVAAYTTDASQKLNASRPRAYSLIFPNIGEMEEPVQRGIAADLDLPLFITSLQEASGPCGLFQSSIELTGTWPLPMQNMWRPAYNYLGRHALQENCSAIITGVGGDEWLGLNPIYSADLIARLDVSGLYRMIIGMWHSWRFPLYVHIYNGVWAYGAKPFLARQVARNLIKVAPDKLRKRRKRSLYRGDPVWFKPDPELMQELSLRMDERVEESIQADKYKNFYIRDLSHAVDHPMNSMDLEEEFENGRRLGIPILGYYQHQELVSYLFRFPPHLLNTGRPQKGLVRELIQKRFPNLGLQKQKKIGATDNFREIVLEESLSVWEKLGGIQSLTKMGIVDADNASENFYSILSDPPVSNLPTWLTWHLINFESWLRKI